MRFDTLTARRLGMIVLGVLALHVLLLGAARDAFRSLERAAPNPRPAALQLRPLAPPAVARAELAAEPARAAPPLVRAGHALPALPALPAVAPRAPAPNDDTIGPPMPAPSALAALPVELRLQAVAGPSGSASAAMPAPSVEGDLPIYRTVLPPAFAFSYDLWRGAVSGSAELHWQPQDERYQARFIGTGGGAPTQEWQSVGGFDAAGLAPARYTDRRRGHGTQAANFQREAGKVTFSGPAVEHALAPGAQDRLSWMLQLAAIAAADPALVGPGGRVTFLVVGARGDADVWTFAHVGEEALALPDGSTPTVRLLRAPGRAYDTRAEVWLDPARHYLPVRARLSNASEGGALQLVLREVLLAP